MGVLLAFAVGYIVGSRAGQAGLEEIKSSIQSIRESEEFAAMVAALRSHAGHALRDAADLVGAESQSIRIDDLVDRVRAMTAEAGLGGWGRSSG